MNNQDLIGALARGYCHTENELKVLDGDLIMAMGKEVEKEVFSSEPNCIAGSLKKVTKDWGCEYWLGNKKDCYAYKRICIKAGHRTSLQYHEHKHETNYIISGEARVLLDKVWHDLKADDYFTIEPGIVHRVEAITDVVLQEVSTDHLHDVIRLEDDTNRPNGHIEAEHA
jgi:mannose-6-phosphate isomerase